MVARLVLTKLQKRQMQFRAGKHLFFLREILGPKWLLRDFAGRACSCLRLLSFKNPTNAFHGQCWSKQLQEGKIRRLGADEHVLPVPQPKNVSEVENGNEVRFFQVLEKLAKSLLTISDGIVSMIMVNSLLLLRVATQISG